MDKFRTNQYGDDLEYCVDPELMTREELVWAVKQLRESNHILTDMIPVDYIIGEIENYLKN